MRRLLLIIFIALAGFPAVLHAQEPPRLEIPIPSLELTPIIQNGDTLTIPWLAQYIGGAYTFLLSIAGMLAAVMMVVGGFQYMTSAGDKGKIGAAKTRIRNALTGLVLALGSYTILYAINPGLVRFDAIQIVSVKKDPFLDAMMNSNASTSEPSSPSVAVTPQSSSPAPGAPTTTDAPYSGTIYKTCPITLTNPSSLAGIPEFMQKIRDSMGTIIDAKTPMDKAVQIGNIAAVCKVHIGNCGKSVGTFLALAGVLNKPKCNQSSTDNKECNSWPEIKVHSIPDTKLLWWARCDNESSKGAPACSFSGQWLANPPTYDAKTCDKNKCGCMRTDCVTGQFSSVTKVTQDILALAKTEKSMAGYPDSWTKDLRRGDWVIMFNGNDDPVGTHSAMFVAWADKDTMITLNGDAVHGVHYSRQCVTSGCFNRSPGWGMFQPITRILRHRY